MQVKIKLYEMSSILKFKNLAKMDLAAERDFITSMLQTEQMGPVRAMPLGLLNATLLPMLFLSLASQRYSPKTTDNAFDEYDYVIVGAGGAGSVVAARLAEMPCVSILLLEAGSKPPLVTEVPGLTRLSYFTKVDWRYKTVPQKYTGDQLVNRQVLWPSGKALGGSTILSGLLYTRANRRDYDAWAAEGAEGWSAKDVYPYFLKLEDNRDPEYVANGFHNVRGPQTVHRSRYSSEIRDPLFNSAKSLGYKVVDPNSPEHNGFYDYQGFLRSGQRCTTAKAYLVPAENRTNLDILTNAMVRRVVIENRRATGVEFDRDGRTYIVKARREVLMAAGTINTAQLLMLSGIGPRKELERHRIPIVADLPVGRNLQDHCSAFSSFELDPSAVPPVLQKVLDPANIAQYLEKRTGIYSSLEFCNGAAFLRNDTKDPKTLPNFQLYFLEASSELSLQVGYNPKTIAQVFLPYEGKPFYICVSHMLQTKSRGTVTLSSTDPYDMPLIDPNYFDDPRDLDAVVEGLKVCNRIASTPQMRSKGSRPFRTLYPGCEKYAGDLDAYLRCVVRAGVITQNHQVGTARMGNPHDPRTVVDTHLRVKHVKGLRVVDASVMPIIPSGSVTAPTLMVAEKAADIIKSTIECEAGTPIDKDSAYYDHIALPMDMHEHVPKFSKKRIPLKVTPWNYELLNSRPWSQGISLLASGISSLVNSISQSGTGSGVLSTLTNGLGALTQPLQTLLQGTSSQQQSQGGAQGGAQGGGQSGTSQTSASGQQQSQGGTQAGQSGTSQTSTSNQQQSQGGTQGGGQNGMSQAPTSGQAQSQGGTQGGQQSGSSSSNTPASNPSSGGVLSVLQQLISGQQSAGPSTGTSAGNPLQTLLSALG